MTTDEFVLDAVKYAGATEGPYFASLDDATDAPDHADSGLAMIDTGRQGDWPIARLVEWNNVPLLIDAPKILAHALKLQAEVERLTAALVAEREACANLCMTTEVRYAHSDDQKVRDFTRRSIAAAIRARGEAARLIVSKGESDG